MSELAKKKARILNEFGLFTGADTQIRTGDLILTKDALYRLSYISRGNSDIIHDLRKKIKGEKTFF